MTAARVALPTSPEEEEQWAWKFTNSRGGVVLHRWAPSRPHNVTYGFMAFPHHSVECPVAAIPTLTGNFAGCVKWNRQSPSRPNPGLRVKYAFHPNLQIWTGPNSES